ARPAQQRWTTSAARSHRENRPVATTTPTTGATTTFRSDGSKEPAAIHRAPAGRASLASAGRSGARGLVRGPLGVLRSRARRRDALVEDAAQPLDVRFEHARGGARRRDRARVPPRRAAP